MTDRSPWPRAASLAALLFALANCSSGAGRPVQEVVVTPDADGVQRVRVVAHSYWFEPNRIVVRANLPVEIQIHNGAFFVPHNFSLVALEADIRVDEGLGLFHDDEVARFTPTHPGEYAFFCDIGSHAEKGMRGTLVVLP